MKKARTAPRLKPLRLATPNTIACTHSCTREGIMSAINSGRLPAYVVAYPNGNRRGMFLIDPTEADKLWSRRDEIEEAARRASNGDRIAQAWVGATA